MENSFKKIMITGAFLLASVVGSGSAMASVNRDVQAGNQVPVNVSTSATNPTPALQSNHVKYGLSEQIISLINEERSKAGIRALVHNRRLERIAMSKVTDTEDNYYSYHYKSRFGADTRRIKSEACSVEGASTPEEFIGVLRNKDAFRNMMLDPDFLICGVSRRGTTWAIELRGEISSFGNKPHVMQDDDVHSGLTAQAVNLINVERFKRGIKLLKANKKLENKAILKAINIQYLYYNYHHISINNTKEFYVDREGCSIDGVSTLEQFIAVLKDNDVFCSMILNPKFEICGVSRRGTTWVIEFNGTRRI